LERLTARATAQQRKLELLIQELPARNDEEYSRSLAEHGISLSNPGAGHVSRLSRRPRHSETARHTARL